MTDKASRDDSSIELRVLVTMRKVLSSVVREIAPQPGMRQPLSEKTMEDVRQCFTLISARERELIAEQGNESAHRPRYTDEPQTTQVVQFQSPDKPSDNQEG